MGGPVNQDTVELWIPITIAAAFGQNLRSALQKYLVGELSTLGSTYSRFLFGVPFAALYLHLILELTNDSLPQISSAFLIYGAIGGLSQIAGTQFLISAFQYRNFAVATTYSKTEALQTALVGLILLGDTLSPLATLAIFIGAAGVIVMSMAHTDSSLRGIAGSLREPAALLGLACGAGFGIAAVCYRAASLELGGGFLLSSAVTLFYVLAFQTIAMGLYLAVTNRDEIIKVFAAWRLTALVGLVGMLSSAGWFAAMTLQNAAYVRALGQVELLFTFAASIFFFREQIKALEVWGTVLVIGSVLLLIFATT